MSYTEGLLAKVRACASVITDTSNKSVLKAFRLSQKEMELFLGILNSIVSDNSAIPNLSAIVKALDQHPRSIQWLRKKGFIKSSGERGQWELTDLAIEKMKLFLSGDLVAATQNPTTQRRKLKKPAKQTKSSSDLQGIKIEEDTARLEEIDREMERLRAEREAILRRVEALVGRLQKLIAK